MFPVPSSETPDLFRNMLFKPKHVNQGRRISRVVRWLVVGTLIVLAVGWSAIDYFVVRGEYRHLQSEDDKRLLDLFRTCIYSFSAERTRELESLFSSPVFDSGHFKEAADRLRSLWGCEVWVTFRGGDGDVLFSESEFQQLNPDVPLWFQELKASSRYNYVAIEKSGGRFFWRFSVPVREGDAFLGVGSALIPFDEVRRSAGVLVLLQGSALRIASTDHLLGTPVLLEEGWGDMCASPVSIRIEHLGLRLACKSRAGEYREIRNRIVFIQCFAFVWMIVPGGVTFLFLCYRLFIRPIERLQHGVEGGVIRSGLVEVDEIIDALRKTIAEHSEQRRWVSESLHKVKQSVADRKLEITVFRKNKQNLMDNIPVLVWSMKDSESVYLVNRSFCDFLGKEHEQVVGSKLSTILPEESAALIGKHAQSAFLNMERKYFEIRIPDSGGASRLLAVNDRPAVNEAGEVESVVFSAVDITERYESECVLRQTLEESEALNAMMSAREKRITELKAEVNNLLFRSGGRAKYLETPGRFEVGGHKGE